LIAEKFSNRPDDRGGFFYDSTGSFHLKGTMDSGFRTKKECGNTQTVKKYPREKN